MPLCSTLLTALLLALFSRADSFLQASSSCTLRGQARCATFDSRRFSTSRLPSSSDDNSYGPPCIIVAGLPESHLETVDDIFSAALGTLPPVIIVNNNDFTSKISLKRLLEDREERDHSLSQRSCDLRSPVIIFSGCDRSAIRLSIQSYKTWNPPSTGLLPRAAFAVVVQPALEKTIKDLCSEILRDFQEEQASKAAAQA